MDSIVDVSHLRKTYGETVAVNDLSFQVHRGEIVGIVGPNGAGKTTTVQCLEGYCEPDSGTVRVLGMDPRHDGARLRERIGVQLQEAHLPHRLKVGEAMDLFASFYRRSVRWQPLLEKLGLAGKCNEVFTKLSGGQKQRLFIALALVNDPELLFLDELSTGLDPHARHAIWEMILDVRNQDKTVLLTTHFMEEAERLCDRVAIVESGRLIALDTPINLIRNLGVENRVIFEVDGHFDTSALEAQAGRVECRGMKVTVWGNSDRLASTVVQTLEAQGVAFHGLRTGQPTLEDVFLTLTAGHVRNEGRPGCEPVQLTAQ